jgi:hypothetical protein
MLPPRRNPIAVTSFAIVFAPIALLMYQLYCQNKDLSTNLQHTLFLDVGQVLL